MPQMPPPPWIRAFYERDFDMIFHYKEAQNLVVEHYERYFEIIFHCKMAQNLVEEH